MKFYISSCDVCTRNHSIEKTSSAALRSTQRGAALLYGVKRRGALSR